VSYSIAVCIIAFFWLLFVLRRDSVSLGLPIAYLFSLLLIHVPGAYVYLVSDFDFLSFSDYVETGIGFTAIGSVSFVAGVWAVRQSSTRSPPNMTQVDERRFSLFCLIGGWLFTYGLSSLHYISSLGAAVDKAAPIWMLGVMLGLRSAVKHSNLIMVGSWLAALAVYPVLMLLLGGFLSYGSGATIIVVSILAISVETGWKVIIGSIVGVFLGLNVFVNYFAHRDVVREEVWGGAPLSDRVDATLDIFRDFEWFDSRNARQVKAIDDRLNQNFFSGLAAARIEQGTVDYLYGRSLWEGLIALVPRALWPEKPVVAGSPKIVSEMTGLELNENTSFGVGNVMEFQINFGIPGLVVGFFLLGFLLRALDRHAAVSLRRANFGSAIVSFLVAVALIQPNGSLVELTGGGAAALVGALGWKWLWKQWSARAGRTNRGTRSYARVSRSTRPSVVTNSNWGDDSPLDVRTRARTRGKT
jgi:hypothetical protein